MFPNDPLAPFYDPSGKQMPPVAKIYLKREKLNGAQCPNGIIENKETDSIQSSRLFDSQDLSDPIRRNQLIAMESNNLIKKNRQKSKEMKFIGTFRTMLCCSEISLCDCTYFLNDLENIDSRCMTTEWGEWSRCSSECGNGLRRRSRQYKDPKAAMNVCNEVLNDTEMCLSENGECDFDRAPNPSEMLVSKMFHKAFNSISNNNFRVCKGACCSPHGANGLHVQKSAVLALQCE